MVISGIPPVQLEMFDGLAIAGIAAVEGCIIPWPKLVTCRAVLLHLSENGRRKLGVFLTHWPHFSQDATGRYGREARLLGGALSREVSRTEGHRSRRVKSDAKYLCHSQATTDMVGMV